ncbi:L-threonylcarbamoyladenylate synthase [Candidatus Symbiobacter mobilis]|uniref:Translation factor-like protein n=1 Tax=Candidatus Symbiobacter mobilis CR TaxID=946483 RepID=U5NE99_9BURK|nr:L-threonylcarbamoyladenylate synthase [Candidatus Symbiobacter mobilis]AGX88553.1 translation factor-like protein [Candidatus Symbiobacter mobilis CR]
MTQRFDVHPDNPQQRLLQQAVALLARGEILAVPTDSSYALACRIADKDAAAKIRRIRGIDEKHYLSLLCRNLSELSTYARVDNQQFRRIKSATPGPFTFILEASKEVPRRLSHPAARTIGLRVPDHKVLQALLELHGEPLLASTYIPAGQTDPVRDADDLPEHDAGQISAIVDCGACPGEPTTIVDLSRDPMEVVRVGGGALRLLGV